MTAYSFTASSDAPAEKLNLKPVNTAIKVKLKKSIRWTRGHWSILFDHYRL